VICFLWRRSWIWGLQSYAPLDGGVLTGKYGQSTSKQGGRQMGHPIPQRKLEVVRLVSEVARDIGCTVSHVALAWLRQQQRFGNAVIPIIGARKAAQIEEHLGGLGVVLDPEQFGRLDQATAVDLGYLLPFLTVRGPCARDFSFAGQFDSVDNHRA
jgi:aryl-alcohol dehydrogenase-like predicted oxidoreductase